MALSRMQEMNLRIQTGGQRMTLPEMIEEEIRQFCCSDAYRIMRQAQEYYQNRSEIQRKTPGIKNRSNVRMEHPILKKLVDQKANYLLSKDFTVDCENKRYAGALEEVFDYTFRRRIRSLGRDAVKCGIAWLAPYFEEGKLKFMRLPSDEVVPIWQDAERSRLEAYIRFYDQQVYEGRRKKTVRRVEYWDRTGVKRFQNRGNGERLYPDYDFSADGTSFEEPHFTVGGKSYNWDEAPLVWVKYNEEELPLGYFIKDLIDDINWQSSVTSDVLRDVANFIFVLRNYGGADLSEFVRDLRQNLAIKVDADGGVDKLQADVNIDAVMAFLEKNRRDIYDYACGVDTKDSTLGNASGTAINFRYMDLDTDCAALACELQDAFLHMKTFLDAYFLITGRGDFTKDRFRIVFNADLPVNESDVISNIVKSEGLVSRRTLLANHPWIRDVDGELGQLQQEAAAQVQKGAPVSKERT